jgi:zinc protease
LVVLGSINPATVSKTAESLLGKWNSDASFKPLLSTYRKNTAVNRKIETPDKENAQFEAGVLIRVSDEDPDYPALLLANYMFGGSISARMPNRIRNVEGLSYGASSRFATPIQGDAAMFAATVSTNPANMPKVEASFVDELTKTARSGFTPTEIAAAKKAYADALRVGRSQDQALLRVLANREQRGRTMQWDQDLEKKIQSLTPDQVNAAFKRHVDAAQLVIVKAGDFKKANVFTN